MYETTGDLNEAVYYERLDADREQAEFEAEGRAYARRQAKAAAALESGDVETAVATCSHGYVGGLTGSCTEGDPRHGQEGARCFDCGAHVTGCHGDVLNVESVKS